MPEKQKQLSMQSIIKKRQQVIGRDEEIAFFTANLARDLEDKHRKFIFNVSGIGGIGKTILLQHFRRIAEEHQAITVWTDESSYDVPTTMAHLVEQMEKYHSVFKAFNERYRTYRQKLQELEADPEAPKVPLAVISTTLAQAGISLGRQIPIAGAALDLIDVKNLSSQIESWSTFLYRKLTNKDEVLLLKEPLTVLTPLFLEGLEKIAEKQPITFFFDTYERTGEYLDQWLRDILKEQMYGEIPANIILVIAGHNKLDKVHWIPYERIITDIKLSPFTEQQTREYLLSKNITDERTIQFIFKISGGVPLLVAILAYESPSDPNQVTEPSGTAVECFLKWEQNPKLRQLVIDASLPLFFNKDILTVLVGEDEADNFFEWLKQKPFVEQKNSYWVYHEVVRTQLLRFKRNQSPQGWQLLQSKLEDFYGKLQNAFELNTEKHIQTFSVNAYYHNLCQAFNSHPSVFLIKVWSQARLYSCADSRSRKALDMIGSFAVQDIDMEEEISDLISDLEKDMVSILIKLAKVEERILMYDKKIGMLLEHSTYPQIQHHLDNSIITSKTNQVNPTISYDEMRIIIPRIKSAFEEMERKNLVAENDKEFYRELKQNMEKAEQSIVLMERKKTLIRKSLAMREELMQCLEVLGFPLEYIQLFDTKDEAQKYL